MRGIIYYYSDFEVGINKLKEIVERYNMMNIGTVKCHYKRWNSWAEFDNGDTWEVKYANDSARGYRWNIAYVERCVPYDVFRCVIQPAGTRMPYNAIQLFGEGDLHIDYCIDLPFR